MGNVFRTNILQLLVYAAASTSSLVIPLYARERGASLEFLGFIGAAHGVAGVLSGFFLARLGDRMDRRLLLSLGFAASAVAYVFQFFSQTPGMLLASRFLVGFVVGSIPATLAAYVYEVRRPLGKFTSYNAMGWLVGGLLIVGAGWLSSHAFRAAAWETLRTSIVQVGPYRLLFALSVLFCLVGWILVHRLAPMRIHLDVPFFPVRLVVENAHVYGPLFLRHLGATAIWIIFPLYVISLGGNLALVGWLHVINMVAQVVVFRNAERFRRVGNARFLIASGLILSALAFASFAWVSHSILLLPLQVLVGASFACLWLGSLKEVMERNSERATASGLLNASMSLSQVVGPLLGGFVAGYYGMRSELIGFHAVMHFGAFVTLLGLVWFFFAARKRPERTAGWPAQAPRPTAEVAP